MGIGVSSYLSLEHAKKGTSIRLRDPRSATSPVGRRVRSATRSPAEQREVACCRFSLTGRPAVPRVRCRFGTTRVPFSLAVAVATANCHPVRVDKHARSCSTCRWGAVPARGAAYQFDGG